MFSESLILALIVGIVHGYPHFQDAIPNGAIVPHPCKLNETWNGVGHKNRNGGGARNPFGLDFAKNGFVWNATICEKDSDGDNRTNGHELGDPGCVWTPGQTAQYGVGLSHPGFCDSVDQCGELPDYVNCESEEFKCAALNEVETFNYTVRLPVTSVPSKETTYMCMLFDFPEGDFHLVATKPEINNADVMHHMILYGCEYSVTSSREMNQAFDCNMSPDDKCNDIIGLWTLGSAGSCIHEDTGFLVGSAGYKRGAIEVHWNNPQHRTDYYDSSGMALYLTPKLRASNAGVFMIGQYSLSIPPNKMRHEVFASCSGYCTESLFRGSINVTSAANHMHYLGIEQVTELYRNGSKVDFLANDPEYSYDSPVVHSFSDPIQIQPGDELTTKCVYKSTSRDTYTYFGLSTSAEMCFSFLTYYPKENVPSRSCVSAGTVDSCERKSGVIDGCNITALSDLSGPLFNFCKTDQCQETCKPVVREMKEHPCFKGEVEQLLRLYGDNPGLPETTRAFIKQLFSLLDSCNTELGLETTTVDTGVSSATSDAGQTGVIDGCDTRAITDLSNPETQRMVDRLFSHCEAGRCLEECKPVVTEMKSEPCFLGRPDKLLRSYRDDPAVSAGNRDKLQLFYSALDSCDDELTSDGVSTGSRHVAAILMLAVSLLAYVL